MFFPGIYPYLRLLMGASIEAWNDVSLFQIDLKIDLSPTFSLTPLNINISNRAHAIEFMIGLFGHVNFRACKYCYNKTNAAHIVFV